MGLPWQPESIAMLSKRFPKALEQTFEVENIVGDDNSDRPGKHRENVFDYQDGVRLIVSKDRFNGNLFLHFSGSLQNGRANVSMLPAFIQRFVELSGWTQAERADTSVSAGGVIHVILPLRQDVTKPPVSPNPQWN